ncbi:manganese efflux pump MntP [Allopusillimonas soli]|uniref:Putative manganese efflux pump MntP n=1 Tax=Allopusillimonas soli TaxID=659016 RepID=A0A853F4Z0_9BURK|nr:manganese efflux pump MntP [Allopusillimonas soli]NYT35574.1 manganese efflux pump MntP [Allopusillimonas soli]TEA75977.1 manganese efflux pump MntP [Allopusillimonas soli]
MVFPSTLLLALAMSADAFAAAVSKGAALYKPRIAEALKTGLIFGVIEGITPIIGWALGTAAAPLVKNWDHWIAFTLLCGLGITMIVGACRKPHADPPEPRTRHSFWMLAVTGFATSIDAMAVGISLAFLDASIVPTAIVIGLTTMVMVTLGVMLGRVLGSMAGRRAALVGGLILILIGAAILYEHLYLNG